MSSTGSSRRRRRFTDGFKAEAAAMVREARGNIAHVAPMLNIYDSTLGNWVRKADAEAAGAAAAEERAAIRELESVETLCGTSAMLRSGGGATGDSQS
jgi:transposase-like protein